MRRAPKPFSPGQIADMADLYGRGWTLEQIAAEADCGAPHVRKHLIAAGVQMRKPGARPGMRLPPVPNKKPSVPLRPAPDRYDAAARAFLGLPPIHPSA